MADEIERIMVIPLRATKQAPRNEKLWENGMRNPPSKITVKAVKFEDGLVEVSLAE